MNVVLLRVVDRFELFIAAAVAALEERPHRTAMMESWSAFDVSVDEEVNIVRLGNFHAGENRWSLVRLHRVNQFWTDQNQQFRFVPLNNLRFEQWSQQFRVAKQRHSARISSLLFLQQAGDGQYLSLTQFDCRIHRAGIDAEDSSNRVR